MQPVKPPVSFCHKSMWVCLQGHSDGALYALTNQMEIQRKNNSFTKHMTHKLFFVFPPLVLSTSDWHCFCIDELQLKTLDLRQRYHGNMLKKSMSLPNINYFLSSNHICLKTMCRMKALQTTSSFLFVFFPVHYFKSLVETWKQLERKPHVHMGFWSCFHLPRTLLKRRTCFYPQWWRCGGFAVAHPSDFTWEHCC